MKTTIQKLYLILTIFLFSLPAWANLNLAPLLNKVTLQLQAEQWVTTKTALVIVNINAAVADQDIGSLQNEVMNKLKQLSSQGEWHIVSINRQLDQSGLESIRITAQARLPQSELSNLRNNAKTISKPGVTFTIDNVLFTPSEEEIEQANKALRDNLYSQAKAEIDALNKMYPDQKYYLYSIDFRINPPVTTMAESTMAIGAMAPAPTARVSPPLAVGNKVELQAIVVIASMPEIMQKLIHP
jgi:hypothetical protein